LSESLRCRSRVEAPQRAFKCLPSATVASAASRSRAHTT
jgi:hypothetical protein